MSDPTIKASLQDLSARRAFYWHFKVAREFQVLGNIYESEDVTDETAGAAVVLNVIAFYSMVTVDSEQS